MRPRSNMGYLSGQNPMEGTARGNRALLPHRGGRFVGARELGPWVGEPKPQGKSQIWGNPSQTHRTPRNTCILNCGHSVPKLCR